MALITDIADAVTGALNSGAFSAPFQAKRYFQPLFELPEMAELHVSVVPSGLSILPQGRAFSQYHVKIDVAVQKKFQTGETLELDPLMTLVEEIADYFRFKRLDTFPEAIWIRTENAPIFAPEHMERFRQFTSVLTFTFRVAR